MSLEILNQLENKIQQTVSTLNSLQAEVNTLRQQNSQLEQQINEDANELVRLTEECDHLKQEQQVWQQRLQSLLSKIEEIN